MIINASPLIIIGKLNKVEILKKLYDSIEITQSVYQEVVVNGMKKNSRDALIVNEHINNNEIKVFKLDNEFIEKARKD